MPETSSSEVAARASECRQSPQPTSQWREMTWAEYYADVRERAARRGVEVIWVTPPDVRSARKAEPAATALAACAQR